METKIVIKTRVEEVKKDFHFGYAEDENSNWNFVNPHDKDEVSRASESLEISEKAVIAICESLDYLSEYLVDELVKDLQDIWEKVNR